MKYISCANDCHSNNPSICFKKLINERITDRFSLANVYLLSNNERDRTLLTMWGMPDSLKCMLCHLVMGESKNLQMKDSPRAFLQESTEKKERRKTLFWIDTKNWINEEMISWKSGTCSKCAIDETICWINSDTYGKKDRILLFLPFTQLSSSCWQQRSVAK